MLKIIGRVFAVIIALLVLLFIAYKILSSIPDYEIDATTIINLPQSPKSEPETYAFGYDPSPEYTEPNKNCINNNGLKNAYYGDLHIHTALSADAFPEGTRTFPEAAYRFAKGEAIALPDPPADAPQKFQLLRALDFAAVTDHAEALGEGYICRNPGAFAGHDTRACDTFRGGGFEGVRVFNQITADLTPKRREAVCGPENKDCIAADKIVWQQIIQAAEAADDKTEACRFTSFVGLEYTRSPDAKHTHRNLIFRNTDVPDIPPSHHMFPFPYQLFGHLEEACRGSREACDVIVIPHNANLSGGNMFNPREVENMSDASRYASYALTRSYERLYEIAQHKGYSECLNRVTDILGDVDELCDIEKRRDFGNKELDFALNRLVPKFGSTNTPECSEDHRDPKTGFYNGGCLSSRDFARGALLEGMQVQQERGVNPHEFGFIGSTDTHISTSGSTEEARWPGHKKTELGLSGRFSTADVGHTDAIRTNPGGLAGVWAVENSRDALFHSMKRRETFGTSGTRIAPRFFAGRYDENICEQSDWLEQAYANGTPMGAHLPPQQTSFNFLLEAKADPMSKPLERLQLVKGWIDEAGQKHNQVIDVVTTNNKNNPEGTNRLCAVFSDPDYMPNTDSYYYLRVVEQVSPRWHKTYCDGLPDNVREEKCKNLPVDDYIHEMAWTSPIWFSPQHKSGSTQ